MSLPEMRRAQRVKEIFPAVNGLFSKMNYTFRQEVTKSNLDIMFVTNYGNRNPSPVVEFVQTDAHYGEALTSQQLTELAGMVVKMVLLRQKMMMEIKKEQGY